MHTILQLLDHERDLADFGDIDSELRYLWWHLLITRCAASYEYGTIRWKNECTLTGPVYGEGTNQGYFFRSVSRALQAVDSQEWLAHPVGDLKDHFPFQRWSSLNG